MSKKKGPVFCVACLENLELAERAGDKDLPVPELATDELLVHDGTRLRVEHVCDHHSGLALDLATQRWGLTMKDPFIAYPMFIH